MSKGRLLAIGAIFICVLGTGAFCFLRNSNEPPNRENEESFDSGDPRLTIATKYENVRPEVAYVGDAACQKCHDKIAESYHQHPMAHTLKKASEAPGVGSPFYSFQSGDYTYEVSEDHGRLFHRETRRLPDGALLADMKSEVEYAIGSGKLGTSFVVNREGWLTESPISWYTQEQKWAVSPGYEHANRHFERPLDNDCLFCHSNGMAPTRFTVNKYQEPLFANGLGIGCERCHGPGELHIKEEEGSYKPQEGFKTTVNPRDLPPSLREAICEQCHLEGQPRLLKRGREPFDFRPGLPLERFYVNFVDTQDNGEIFASGHVEQMHVSACYKKSNGRFGCTSCHDPHETPAPKERFTYYRKRCLECHGPQSQECSLAKEVRIAKSPEDSCIACHMPRAGSTEIPHTALTDHRVARRPGKGPPAPAEALGPLSDPSRLVSFHRDAAKSADPEAERDFGIALASFARIDLRQPVFNLPARRFLEAATVRNPDDGEAWTALAKVYAARDRHAETLTAIQNALKGNPDQELPLAITATTLEALKRHGEALKQWPRVLELNPFNSVYHGAFAKTLINQQRWEQAVAEAEKAIALNPEDAEARRSLVLGLHRMGRKAEARGELDKLAGLVPQHADEIRRWYAHVDY